MSNFFLLTFGCPKNQVVSENISQILIDNGYKQSLDIVQSDVVIVNTCGFIASAITENQAAIKAIQKQIKDNQQLIVYGCIPQRLKNPETIELKNVQWAADIKELQRLLPKIKTTASKRINTYQPYAFVEIAEGCNQNCAFCTIPTFKGHYRSKKPAMILKEIKELLSVGVKEIIIIAQETTFYGIDLKPTVTLSQLLTQIETKFPEIVRIRLMYAHPNGLTTDLIKVLQASKKICAYIDIPLQHIDGTLLKSMNRHYTQDKVKQTIEDLRSALPNIAIRSTFIVGFPGETEAQFEKLKQFLQEYHLDYAGFFAYEKESGTVAATLVDQIPQKIKQQRLNEIYELQQSIEEKRSRKYLKKTMPVLIDYEDEDYYFGRSNFQAPEIDGYVLLPKKTHQHTTGDIVDVTISKIEFPNLIAK